MKKRRLYPGRRGELQLVITPDMRLDWLTREEREALTNHANDVMNMEYEKRNVKHKFLDDLQVAAREAVKKLLANPTEFEDWDYMEFSYLFHFAVGEGGAGCGSFFPGDMDEFRLAEAIDFPIPEELEEEREEMVRVHDDEVMKKTDRWEKMLEAICTKLDISIDD